MLKFVENFAMENNCKTLEGFCYPNGEFQFGTIEFYKRNGFSFSKKGDLSYITKSLTPSITKEI